jgi:adenosylcobinamide-phosphate synthase
MAMAAGLLGLRLDKPGAYVLGEALAAPVAHDIGRAIRLVRAAGCAAFAVALAAVARVGLGGLYGAL